MTLLEGGIMFWLWLVVIQLVVFTFLVVFLKVVLTRNISTATAHLHELNQDYNQKAEDANKRKQEVDRYYDEMLLKAKADAEKNKVQILREAQATQDMMLKQARQQSEEIIEQANRSHEVVLAEMESRIEARGAERACELAGRVLTSEMSEALHKLWVKELLKTGLENLGRLHVPGQIQEVPVASAFALSDEQKSLIQKKLKDTLGHEIRLSESVRPEMIAGLQITLGSLVIDGSLRYKIKEASRDGLKRA
jgi:F0F1-type ATP synthase membrane subunit b/b'